MNRYIVALPDGRNVQILAASEYEARKRAEGMMAGFGRVTICCITRLVMARPGTPKELAKKWRQQAEDGHELRPEPNGHLRTWLGDPKLKDYFLLEAVLIRDGWRLIQHAREFREIVHGGANKEVGQMGQCMPQIPGR